ncbi:hypothetical protein ACFUVV_12115 [Streptomyces sp. NPDC057376]|uniref:hypothetical protein n=1 Tax=Streptomyces sp. NPDC057376 TaxID=3346110 RepID=UPI0036380071
MNADGLHGPDECHEEAAGTAFWWTGSLPAWPHGVIVFWRHGRDWRLILLDRDEKLARDGTGRLPWPAELPPDEAAQRVAELLTEARWREAATDIAATLKKQ